MSKDGQLIYVAEDSPVESKIMCKVIKKAGYVVEALKMVVIVLRKLI